MDFKSGSKVLSDLLKLENIDVWEKKNFFFFYHVPAAFHAEVLFPSVNKKNKRINSKKICKSRNK